MISMLFRVQQLASGSIFIDNIDISTVPLSLLRQRLAIVTQDPVIFSGSFRDNIDPFHLYLDNQIWSILSLVQFVETVKTKFKGNLNFPIRGTGHQFSLGEMSQIGLARALIKNSKILLIDEATASIDYSTDYKIQSALKNCGGATVLTIAHRLNTLMEYSRIMVLADGKIAEFDSPLMLLQNRSSHLYSLASDLGTGGFSNLKSLAAAADEGNPLSEEDLLDLVQMRFDRSGEISSHSKYSEQTREIFSRVLELQISDIHLDSKLEDFDLSFDVAQQVLIELKEVFDLSNPIDYNRFLECKTIDEIGQLIQQEEFKSENERALAEIPQLIASENELENLDWPDNEETNFLGGEKPELKSLFSLFGRQEEFFEDYLLSENQSRSAFLFSLCQLVSILSLSALLGLCLSISHLIVSMISYSIPFTAFESFGGAAQLLLIFIFVTSFIVEYLIVLVFLTRLLTVIEISSPSVTLHGLVHYRLWAFQALFRFIRPVLTPLFGTEYYNILLRLLGASIGPNSYIYTSEIDCPALINIGQSCFIAPNVSFCAVQIQCESADNEEEEEETLKPEKIKEVSTAILKVGNIRVGDHASISEGCVIHGSAQIGARCFIEPLSFVDQKLPSQSTFDGSTVREGISQQSGKQFKNRTGQEFLLSMIFLSLFFILLTLPYAVGWWAIQLLVQPVYNVFIQVAFSPLYGLLSSFLLAVIYRLNMRDCKTFFNSGRSCRLGSYKFFQYVWFQHAIFHYIHLGTFMFQYSCVQPYLLKVLGVTIENFNFSTDSLILGRVSFYTPLSFVKFQQPLDGSRKLFMDSGLSVGSLRVVDGFFQPSQLEFSCTHNILSRSAIIESSIIGKGDVGEITNIQPGKIFAEIEVSKPSKIDSQVEIIDEKKLKIPTKARRIFKEFLAIIFLILFLVAPIVPAAFCIDLIYYDIPSSVLLQGFIASLLVLFIVFFSSIILLWLLFSLTKISVYAGEFERTSIIFQRFSFYLRWLQERLFVLWVILFGAPLTQTPYLCSILRVFGAKIGSRTILCDSAICSDFSYFSVGSDCFLADGITFRPAEIRRSAFYPFFDYEFSSIRVENRVSIERQSILTGGAQVRNSVKVQPITFFPINSKGIILPENSIWQGNLPKRLK